MQVVYFSLEASHPHHSQHHSDHPGATLEKMWETVILTT